MNNNDQPILYTTVARSVRVRVPIGACRFFASVKEVVSEAEAKAFIADVSDHFADATHNAWAYKLGYGPKSISRSNDAGEPVNTAGPPMLQAIEGQDLTDVVVVGTRYYGGVNLGIGGLIRAYRDTAAAGLEEAGRRQEIIMIPVAIRQVDYAYLGDILREIESRRGLIDDIEYSEQVTVLAQIRPLDETELRQRIIDLTRGQSILEVL